VVDLITRTIQYSKRRIYLVSEHTALLALVPGVAIETLALAGLEVTQATTRAVMKVLVRLELNDGSSVNKFVPLAVGAHLHYFYKRIRCVVDI
jgi:hypothetical protein